LHSEEKELYQHSETADIIGAQHNKAGDELYYKLRIKVPISHHFSFYIPFIVYICVIVKTQY